MPRCQCGAGTCACQINAADSTGISISGSGTQGDPWVLDVIPQDNSILPKIDFVDSETVAWTETGSGLSTDALKVTADAHTRLTESIDIADPEGDTPANGDTLVWTTDHWEYRQIPSGPPTTVQTGAGVKGDGSVGTPVALSNSGTWDATTQGIWGPTNTSQLMTYIDTNGQVRVPGDLIDAGVVGRLAADGLDKYPSGVSLLALSTAASSTGLWPGAGSVLTTKRNSTQGTQYWMSLPTLASAIPPRIQYRFNDNTGWSAWVDVFYDSGWINMTPASGSGPLQYRIRNNTVTVRANLSGMTPLAVGSNGAISASGAVPAAYRPGITAYAAGSGGGPGSTLCLVGTDGTVTQWNNLGGPVTVARCTISYPRE